MESRKLRVGQPITAEEFGVLSDAQLERLVPKASVEDPAKVVAGA